MLKSLYSGISGMKGFQTKLDVIGNNIANVNTVGFKKSRVMFQDIMNQNITGATPPQARQGGTNPIQIGLGSKISSIDTLHTPGSPMTTSFGSDLMIDGDAYFIVGPEKELNGNIEPEGNLLTKAGNFTLDGNGFLVSSNGFFVSGTTGEPGVGGATGTLKQVAIKITEDEVDPSNPKLKFTSYSIDSNGFINVVREDGKIGVLAIDASGKYKLSEDPQSTENISLTTATVSNPSGLSKVGNTMFQVTGNSGAANTGRISDIKGGSINAGALEMSNVDLTEEFTEMIVAQRGFQANSRIITTSDSILEELVNLKR